jgi:hypothetical protein
MAQIPVGVFKTLHGRGDETAVSREPARQLIEQLLLVLAADALSNEARSQSAGGEVHLVHEKPRVLAHRPCLDEHNVDPNGRRDAFLRGSTLAHGLLKIGAARTPIAGVAMSPWALPQAQPQVMDSSVVYPH